MVKTLLHLLPLLFYSLLPNILSSSVFHPVSTFQARSQRKCKDKGTLHSTWGQESSEGEQRYGSTLSLISALNGVGGQRHAPAALPPGKNRYPLYRRLGGSQGRSGRARKILSPPGFDLRTVQPVPTELSRPIQLYLFIEVVLESSLQ